MSKKHTPGPWVTDDFNRNDTARHVMNGNGNGPVYIAKIPLVNSVGGKSDSYKSQEANARLISAAPDLLESLQHAVSSYGAPGGPWNVPSEPGTWLKRAKAAITKATGEPT